MSQPSSFRLDLTDTANALWAVGGVAPNGFGNVPTNGRPAEVGAVYRELQILLLEATDKATEFKALILDWVKLLPTASQQSITSVVSQTLQTSRCCYDTLTPEQNSRLSILVQISGFVCFLKKQIKDEAYGDNREGIDNVQLKILKVGRHIRQLLPITDQAIIDYVLASNAGKELSLGNYKAAVKRAVFFFAVNLMLNTLSRIKVAVDTGSVTMA